MVHAEMAQHQVLKLIIVTYTVYAETAQYIVLGLANNILHAEMAQNIVLMLVKMVHAETAQYIILRLANIVHAEMAQYIVYLQASKNIAC